MKVSELAEYLSTLDPDLEVITDHFSDYQLADPRLVEAVPKDWGIMRAHPTMSSENAAKETTYLLISY